MGKNKNKKQDNSAQSDSVRQNSGLESNNFYRDMIEQLRLRLDNDIFSSRNNSTMQNSIAGENNQSREQANLKDELVKKELELKNKEVELLKRENELLRRAPEHINNPEMTSSGSVFPFRDIEGSLNSFSGDDDYAVEKWIEDVNEASVGVGWNDAQKVVYAKKLLSGTAKQSLRTTKDVGTWDKLALFLRAEFRKDTTSSKIHKKMRDRKILPKETYRSYLLTLQEIALAANIDDASIIDY